MSLAFPSSAQENSEMCAETFLGNLCLQYLHPLRYILDCTIDTSWGNCLSLEEVA